MEAFKVSTKTEQKLKEFLGASMPNPLDGKSIMLHDLLSKPFCEAFIKERFARGLNSQSAAWEIVTYLEMVVNSYYSGGLPAVEKSLTEMMEGK